MNLRAMYVLTLMMCGRAMTLAFIHRAGGTAAGDPPAAWLLPLLGDAVIGVGALGVLYLMARRRGLWVWTTVVVWNALAAWDALSAYVVHKTTPWPEFFMIQLFGSSMFFATATLHLLLLAMACRPDIRQALIQKPMTGQGWSTG